jgi:hypothetical protein
MSSAWSSSTLYATLAVGFVVYLVYRIEVHPRIFNKFRHLPTAKVRYWNGIPDAQLMNPYRVDYHSSVMGSFNSPTLAGKPI